MMGARDGLALHGVVDRAVQVAEEVVEWMRQKLSKHIEHIAAMNLHLTLQARNRAQNRMMLSFRGRTL
jgi:hypothetical protein